jgi:SAM-dependent methyltransferase
MLGEPALAKLLGDYSFQTVLDVGSGKGEQAQVMRAAGKTVTTLDLVGPADILQEFIEPFCSWYDAVWCCHVLEHQRNVGAFLDKLREDIAPAGILAITVPPCKPRTVAGHLSLWTPGLLLYNLVCAGFDCSEASLYAGGYDISVIVRRGEHTKATNRTTFDEIAQYFPCPVEPGGFDCPKEINW